MAKYFVPVIYEVQGYINVEAASPAEALAEAKNVYSQSGLDAVRGRVVDVDFALGGDLSAVELEEEEET